MKPRKERRLSSEVTLHKTVLKGKCQRMLDRITAILRLQMKNNVMYVRLYAKNIKIPRRAKLAVNPNHTY